MPPEAQKRRLPLLQYFLLYKVNTNCYFSKVKDTYYTVIFSKVPLVHWTMQKKNPLQRILSHSLPELRQSHHTEIPTLLFRKGDIIALFFVYGHVLWEQSRSWVKSKSCCSILRWNQPYFNVSTTGVWQNVVWQHLKGQWATVNVIHSFTNKTGYSLWSGWNTMALLFNI